jgi:hypothetical protein
VTREEHDGPHRDPEGRGGASDVEPLIPVQDELNCRLSDRGYRISVKREPHGVAGALLDESVQQTLCLCGMGAPTAKAASKDFVYFPV